MFELLESRLHFALDACVIDGTLVIRGTENSVDEIVITRGDVFSTLNVLVTSDGFSFLEPQPFRGVTRGIRIDLGGGDDSVTLHGARVFGSVVIDGGAGDDTLVVRAARPTGNLVWRGGEGDDRILIRKSTIQGNLLLDGGAGRDRTELSFVHARSNLRIDDTDGGSIITFTRLSVDANARIAAGASADTLTIHDSTFKRDATVTTSRGDDRIRVRGTIFRQTPILNAGSGENDIDREVILTWDFDNGAQGWEAGFSDYDAGQVIGTKPDGSPLIAEEAFELHSGIQPLPEELDASVRGFELSGRNLSDDLFMYVARPINGLEGIVPKAQYLISYSIKFASDLPAESQSGTDRPER